MSWISACENACISSVTSFAGAVNFSQFLLHGCCAWPRERSYAVDAAATIAARGHHTCVCLLSAYKRAQHINAPCKLVCLCSYSVEPMSNASATPYPVGDRGTRFAQVYGQAHLRTAGHTTATPRCQTLTHWTSCLWSSASLGPRPRTRGHLSDLLARGRERPGRSVIRAWFAVSEGEVSSSATAKLAGFELSFAQRQHGVGVGCAALPEG